MDTLDRFLVREFLKYFFIISIGMALLFVGVDFLTKFWKFDLPMFRLIEMYAYKFPSAVQQFVPLACLMAVLLVLSSMSRENEILALFSSGVGALRIISTFIAIVATVSTVSFLVFDSLVPGLRKREIMLRQGLDPNVDYVLITERSGLWYRNRTLIYNVGRYTPQTNTIQDVTVYRLTPTFQLKEIVHAKSGVYDGRDWVLKEGHIARYGAKKSFPSTEKFETLVGVIPEKPQTFKTIQLDEKSMKLRNLREYIDRNKGFGLDTTAQQVHYHERVALVFSPLIFILLGIPFAMKPLKTQSLAKSISFCFLVVFLYLLLFRTSLSVGKGGRIPPVLAAWVPNIIFLAFTGWLMRRKSHA